MVEIFVFVGMAVLAVAVLVIAARRKDADGPKRTIEVYEPKNDLDIPF